MELERLDPEGSGDLRPSRQVIWSRVEDGVWRALQASPKVRAQVINRAYEVFVFYENVGEGEAEEDRTDPSSNESFQSLFGRYLDQWSATKRDTADVGPDIVGDYKRRRQEEPYHALENIVHHEVCLEYYQKQSHMCPSKLSKLSSVEGFLQRSDEENEACNMLADASIGRDRCHTHDVHHEADEAMMGRKRQ